MFALLNQWNGRVTTWLARISAFILAVLAVLTFLDVVGRYFFNSPFTFTVEFTELAMGLIVYLAVGLTTHNNEHISVDVVTLRLRERMRALLEFITGILALGFLVLMIWRVWLQADLLLTKGDTTPVKGWPIWPVAFVMAAGGVFFLTGVLVRAGDALGRAMGRQGHAAAPSERPYTD
jgi:TRAP-type C4-dicarboxylate transport system permease small subunit